MKKLLFMFLFLFAFLPVALCSCSDGEKEKKQTGSISEDSGNVIDQTVIAPKENGAPSVKEPVAEDPDTIDGQSENTGTNCKSRNEVLTDFKHYAFNGSPYTTYADSPGQRCFDNGHNRFNQVAVFLHEWG